jgi:membrane associated rhomboid family serine protease
MAGGALRPGIDAFRSSGSAMTFPATDDYQDQPRITPTVQWLIAINVAIYFLQLTVVNPMDMAGALGFEMRDLTEQPWTIVTYMFVHAGFLHVTMNMYMLWLFGRRLERAWSPGSFLWYYLWCGLGGWLFHMMLTRDGLLLGASAAVFGVMLAYAMRWPDEELVLFPFPITLKVKWLVAILAGLNLVSGLATLGATGSGVAHFAHLGGFAFGWMYLRWNAAPSIDRLRQRMSQIPDVSDETPRAIPRTHRPRERASEIDEIVARSNAVATQRPTSAALSSKAGKTKTDQLNDVLDKISEKGIGSLTSEERRLLEEMSKRLRDS